MKKALGGLIFLLLVAQAYALPINSPVPSDAYITYAGLDWAWGGPCPYSDGCFATGDLTYQSTQGWSLPTTAELEALPSNFASFFITGSGNVPYGGTDPVSGANFSTGPVSPALSGACATPYFNTVGEWCDWSDGVAGFWAGAPNDPYPYTADQLYVRSSGVTPEPASLILVGGALIGLVLRRRFVRG